MALIKCPECGKENVSDTAQACPRCGFGIRNYFIQLKSQRLAVTNALSAVLKVKSEKRRRRKIALKE